MPHFVESLRTCDHEGCTQPLRIVAEASGRGYCLDHAPQEWRYQARRNLRLLQRPPAGPTWFRSCRIGRD